MPTPRKPSPYQPFDVWEDEKGNTTIGCSDHEAGQSFGRSATLAELVDWADAHLKEQHGRN